LAYLPPMRRLLQQWRRDRHRLVLNGFCLALIGVMVVTGAAGLREELRASSAMAARIDEIPRDHGELVVRRFGGPRRGFTHFARQLIPPDEPFRLVQPAKDNPRERRVCQPGVPGGEHFWMVYSLVPRPKTCDPNARWSVYLGIAPRSLPPGAKAHVYQHRPDLVVVERDGAR
jgi:hypothetical protein